MRFRLSLFLLFFFCLSSCQQDEEALREGPQLSLGDVLGGDNVEGFLRVEQPRDFVFPQDHASHEGYRNEWWYVTGNVITPQGRRFGYQVTFFNAALGVPGTAGASSASAWTGNKFWMAHAALTDLENNQHIGLERFSRANPGLAGATISPFKVWLENWRLESQDNDFPWHLTLVDPEFSLDLWLTADKPLVLQGVAGLSQKSPEPGNASYYYSFTRLNTEGEISIGGETLPVSGASWLDREWSTSALSSEQTGWDWFSLQFNDGQELMYYQLRDADGRAHANSQGNWTDKAGQQFLITAEDVSLEQRQVWESSAGVIYTTEWLLRYQGSDWIIKAIMDDQLMDVSFQYWEGAIDILSAESGEVVGAGYLEMVRE